MLMRIDAKEKSDLLDALNRMQNLLERMPEQKSCWSCTQFDTDKQICKMHNQEPPIHIKNEGCKSWELITIPPF